MPEAHARVDKVAQAAASAWHRSAGSSGDGGGIPIGVVAAVSLFTHRAPDDDTDPAEEILSASAPEIARMLEEVWCLFTIARPDLAFRCGPFGAWLDEEPLDPSLIVAAAAVAKAVIEAGLAELTVEPLVEEVDLLGHLYPLLRPAKARQARGEFYTPPSLAELMARMSVGSLEPGQSVCDPCAGTGGLLRGAAQALRAEGKEPHEYWWYGCDVSAVVVAGLAVNCHLWGLGPRVVVGCADSLAEPNWQVRAAKEQREAVELQEARLKAVSLLAASSSLEGRGRS